MKNKQHQKQLPWKHRVHETHVLAFTLPWKYIDLNLPSCWSDAVSFWHLSWCRWQPQTPAADSAGSPGWWCLHWPPVSCGGGDKRISLPISLKKNYLRQLMLDPSELTKPLTWGHQWPLPVHSALWCPPPSWWISSLEHQSVGSPSPSAFWDRWVPDGSKPSSQTNLSVKWNTPNIKAQNLFCTTATEPKSVRLKVSYFSYF